VILEIGATILQPDRWQVGRGQLGSDSVIRRWRARAARPPSDWNACSAKSSPIIREFAAAGGLMSYGTRLMGV
jgi:hypothetical protein